MKKLFYVLAITLLLTGCWEDKLVYLEPDPVESSSGIPVDSYGNTFSFSPAEDNRQDIYQNTAVFTAELLVHGEHLYFPLNRALYRYNMTTGNLTNICGDPLCNHDSDVCPFGNMQTISSIFDDQIYFKKAIPDVANRVKTGPNTYFTPILVESWVYDISTQQLSKSRREYQESSLRYANEYCTAEEEFYFDMIQDEETGEWSKALKGYNRLTGKNRMIRHMKGDPDTVITMEKKGKLLYCDGISIGWLDAQTGEKDVIYAGECGIVSADAEYLYFLQRGSLWRMKQDGSDLRELGIQGILTDYNITDEYIYFRYDNPVDFGQREVDPLHTALGAPPSRVELNGLEIWRAEKDGSNPTRVFSFTEEHYGMTIDKMFLAGNYIYGYWTRVTDGEVYYSKNDTDAHWGSLLRIDITTGQLYYIEVPK